MSSKMLIKMELSGQAGTNSVEVGYAGLTSGVIYYKLQAFENTNTKHMIVIE